MGLIWLTVKFTSLIEDSVQELMTYVIWDLNVSLYILFEALQKSDSFSSPRLEWWSIYLSVDDKSYHCENLVDHKVGLNIELNFPLKLIFV